MELHNLGYYIGNIKIHRLLSELGETVCRYGRKWAQHTEIECGERSRGSGEGHLCKRGVVGNPAFCRVTETALVCWDGYP